MATEARQQTRTDWTSLLVGVVVALAGEVVLVSLLQTLKWENLARGSNDWGEYLIDYNLSGFQVVLALAFPALALGLASFRLERVQEVGEANGDQVGPVTEAPAPARNLVRFGLWSILGMVVSLAVNVAANVLVPARSPYYMGRSASDLAFGGWLTVVLCSPLTMLLGAVTGLVFGNLGRNSRPVHGFRAVAGGMIAGAVAWVVQYSLWFLGLPM